jgi:hypothetical protein
MVRGSPDPGISTQVRALVGSEARIFEDEKFDVMSAPD